MKVILLEDIAGTGKKGQMINASDGHARNYLIPKKLAVEATKANIAQLEQQQKAMERQRQKELTEAQELAKELSEKSIRIPVKMGKNGKLFGSVTNKEIAAAFLEQTGMEIDRKKILLTEPVKSAGEKKVEIKLHPQVTAQITINIYDPDCGA